MTDQFNNENPYAEEAKKRWGNTKAYRQSQERYGRLSAEEKQKIAQDNEELLQAIIANISKGANSPEIMELIDRHYNGLRIFYDPSYEMYRGLADMYLADPRFTAYYDKYQPGLAQFMRDAMHAYCDLKKSK